MFAVNALPVARASCPHGQPQAFGESSIAGLRPFGVPGRRRPRTRIRQFITAATALAFLGIGGEVLGCTDTGFSITKWLAGRCCYEGIRAKCGELSIGPYTSGRSFEVIAPKIADAIEREGGEVTISDADLRYIVARFSRWADLPEIKRRLEAEATIRWVSYRPLVQLD